MMDKTNAETSGSDTKVCPFCAEEIKSAAILCRYCGMNLQTGAPMRGQPSSSPPVSRPSPRAPEGPETIIWQGQPAYISYIASFIIGALLVPLAGIGIVIIIWAILDRKHRFYKVTNRRVSVQSGIIGRATSEVEIRDIRNVKMLQGVIDRLLGFDNVGISSAGTGQVEVIFAGVPNPSGIKYLVAKVKGANQRGEAYTHE